jgi:hypothetical protein
MTKISLNSLLIISSSKGCHSVKTMAWIFTIDLFKKCPNYKNLSYPSLIKYLMLGSNSLKKVLTIRELLISRQSDVG